MKANVLSLEGKKVGEIELPKVFESEVDEGLIRRAVLSIQSMRLQPKGPNPRAGRETTATYVAKRGKPAIYRTINVDRARLPRKKNRRALLYGDVAKVPQAVGGTSPHSPVVEKIIYERINKKEKKKATAAAIAATAIKELVKKRGHKFDESISLPLVVDEKIEELEKTKDVVKVLKALKIWEDIERAKEKRKIRAGKGRKRGRKYKKPKSILIVSKEKSKIFRAARNLAGVDVVSVKDLNAELLAPGAMPGRLTLWSAAAIAEMQNKW